MANSEPSRNAKVLRNPPVCRAFSPKITHSFTRRPSYINVYRDILLNVAKRTRELDTGGCTALARFMLVGIDGLLLQELADPNGTRSKRSLDALIRSAQLYADALGADARSSNKTARIGSLSK